MGDRFFPSCCRMACGKGTLYVCRGPWYGVSALSERRALRGRFKKLHRACLSPTHHALTPRTHSQREGGKEGVKASHASLPVTDTPRDKHPVSHTHTTHTVKK
mmetsp:Transcript_47529/g.118785  ORF Transcript_47529/g.118785 Transcript_47529/m.118785 type:complete len:103 (-) Transcript_47529:28-336(-)